MRKIKRPTKIIRKKLFPLGAISGPSGSGKDYIAKEIFDSGLAVKFISATTRTPRKGERDGIDYYFMTDEEYDKCLKENRFFEHIEYGSTENGEKPIKYGFLKKELKKLEKSPCIAILTPEGAEQLRKHVNTLIHFYVKTDDELRKTKTLERYGNQAEKYKKQIEERIIIDKEIFEGLENEPEVITLYNNYDKESFETNLKKIVSQFFNLDIKNTVSKNAEVWE